MRKKDEMSAYQRQAAAAIAVGYTWDIVVLCECITTCVEVWAAMDCRVLLCACPRCENHIMKLAGLDVRKVGTFVGPVMRGVEEKYGTEVARREAAASVCKLPTTLSSKPARKRALIEATKGNTTNEQNIQEHDGGEGHVGKPRVQADRAGGTAGLAPERPIRDAETTAEENHDRNAGGSDCGGEGSAGSVGHAPL